ncbi:DUF3592 domain-containing protein [Kitasatospora sp. NPDC059722]|uniref:DUF3592 domain-containing protein n=1 Tax=Kitasatospora sp. NPDC059722 TaxID=3346925 RepID=UPI0036903464
MSESGNFIGVFFVIVGLVLAGAGLASAIGVAGGANRRARILQDGVPAEGQCLETFVTVERRVGSDLSDPGRHVRHTIIGFRTADGRDIRIEETSGVPRVVGDHVPVRYLPLEPHVAMAVDRSPAGQAAASGAKVAMGVVFMVVGLFVVVVGIGIASGGFDSGPPHVPGFPAPQQPGPGGYDFP